MSGPVIIESDEQAVPIKAWTQGVPFEAAALDQVVNVARLPFVHKWVAVMPDVHAGRGSTIGCVIATKGAIMPAAVGVDIGCGMAAIQTDIDRREIKDVKRLRAAIEAKVPCGRTANGQLGDRGAWEVAPDEVSAVWEEQLEERYDAIRDQHPDAIHKRPVAQLGTLGTGNHFIELCTGLDANEVWIVLHSGSRGPGNRIGTYFTKLAQAVCAREGVVLPDPELAYLTLGTDEMRDYLDAVTWAQKYALRNRRLMLAAVTRALGVTVKRHVDRLATINCFAGETRILTRHGVSPIQDLVGTTPTLLTPDGWVEAPVRSFGQQALMKLTLSRCGAKKVVFATAQHCWLVEPVQRQYIIETTTERLVPGARLAPVFPARLGVAPSPAGIERRAWTVVSVERTDRFEEVFCAEVEGTHAFALEDNILTRNCHHNYVAREKHYDEHVFVTRKGAVFAGEGALGIIPGSMGARTYIVEGLGNPESFTSCSHGAGRSMSRTQAKRSFTVADHIRAVAGVECRIDAEVLDETPAAYKDIEAVMAAQADLVRTVTVLKQFVCIKG